VIAAILTVECTGEVRCLYTEALNLSAIGSLKVVRASQIEFNNENQQWEVRSMEGNLVYSDCSRTACLEWERKWLS
jgi:hypothetical protein